LTKVVLLYRLYWVIGLEGALETVIGGWKNPTSKGMVWQPARNANSNRTERAVYVMDDSNSGATTNFGTDKAGYW
jgi:hypothetical protein